MNVSNLLCGMDEGELYRLLGEAWYAQLQPKPGTMVCLEAGIDTGRREFNGLRPALPVEISQLDFHDAVICASRVIAVSGAWRMPATVVAALALKPGLMPTGVSRSNGYSNLVAPTLAT